MDIIDQLTDLGKRMMAEARPIDAAITFAAATTIAELRNMADGKFRDTGGAAILQAYSPKLGDEFDEESPTN